MAGKRILLVCLVLINLFLLFRLVWSGQGIFAYMELKQRHEALEKQLQKVDARSLDLSREIGRLKNDRAYQEKVIRDRMNFVKKNEILYIFHDNEVATTGVKADGEKN